MCFLLFFLPPDLPGGGAVTCFADTAVDWQLWTIPGSVLCVLSVFAFIVKNKKRFKNKSIKKEQMVSIVCKLDWMVLFSIKKQCIQCIWET